MKSKKQQKKEQLERYFSDLKFLFLRKFEKFCSSNINNEHQEKALLELVDEIVYVKKLLDEERL
jgi:hypothetical protein